MASEQNKSAVASGKEMNSVSIRYETRNPLPVASRDAMIEQLNRLMADILDNHYQSLLAHWNTRGSNFIALHKLFEDYAGSSGAENWCDWVAERISQLGGTVETTIPFIAAKTSLPEYPLSITTGEEHAQALVNSAGIIIRRVQEVIALAQELEDQVTVDILGQVQRSAEKYLWFLEAHIPQVRQSDAGSS
jgi:starvation-inducible DNA-binding protein